jgi:hypothetical protein
MRINIELLDIRAFLAIYNFQQWRAERRLASWILRDSAGCDRPTASAAR